MDIQQYQRDRDAELQQFKKEYTSLKVEYTRLLSKAIYEPDPKAQEDLVKQILEVNSQIATHVREFLGKPAKFDPKTISDLTKDIVMYQTEYSEIKNAENRNKTFHSILNKETVKLTQLRSEFNIFLGCLLGGIVIIVILIFRTSRPPLEFPDLQQPNISTSEIFGGLRRFWT
jgi:hypothetical protein